MLGGNTSGLEWAKLQIGLVIKGHIDALFLALESSPDRAVGLGLHSLICSLPPPLPPASSRKAWPGFSSRANTGALRSSEIRLCVANIAQRSKPGARAHGGGEDTPYAHGSRQREIFQLREFNEESIRIPSQWGKRLHTVIPG